MPEHLREKGVAALRKHRGTKTVLGRPISDKVWQRLSGMTPASPRLLLFGDTKAEAVSMVGPGVGGGQSIGHSRMGVVVDSYEE